MANKLNRICCSKLTYVNFAPFQRLLLSPKLALIHCSLTIPFLIMPLLKVSASFHCPFLPWIQFYGVRYVSYAYFSLFTTTAMKTTKKLKRCRNKSPLLLTHMYKTKKTKKKQHRIEVNEIN